MTRLHSHQLHRQRGAESENEDAGLIPFYSLNPKHQMFTFDFSSLLPLSSAGGSDGPWDRKQHTLPPPSSVVAPPPGSLHLNALQQHSSLLANRQSQQPNTVSLASHHHVSIVHLLVCLRRSVRPSFYGHATPPPLCGPASCQHDHGCEPDGSAERSDKHGRCVTGTERTQGDC